MGHIQPAHIFLTKLLILVSHWSSPATACSSVPHPPAPSSWSMDWAQKPTWLTSMSHMIIQGYWKRKARTIKIGSANGLACTWKVLASKKNLCRGKLGWEVDRRGKNSDLFWAPWSSHTWWSNHWISQLYPFRSLYYPANPLSSFITYRDFSLIQASSCKCLL